MIDKPKEIAIRRLVEDYKKAAVEIGNRQREIERALIEMHVSFGQAMDAFTKGYSSKDIPELHAIFHPVATRLILSDGTFAFMDQSMATCRESVVVAPLGEETPGRYVFLCP